MPNITDFDLVALDGSPMPLTQYKGRVVLMVNVASMCGFTPQYTGLEQLWRTYKARGLTIIGCPCDQFGHQEPGTEAEIGAFCSSKYDVTFPLSAKLEVNGDAAHPLWAWLKQAEPGVLGTTSVKWNFTKFLVGRDGTVIGRYAPTATPESLIKDIETALLAQ
jgi:glutathione peroxidase